MLSNARVVLCTVSDNSETWLATISKKKRQLQRTLSEAVTRTADAVFVSRQC